MVIYIISISVTETESFQRQKKVNDLLLCEESFIDEFYSLLKI